jgi:hypothetical protein
LRLSYAESIISCPALDVAEDELASPANPGNERQGIEIPLVIIGAEDVPIYFTNLFVVQHEEKEFIITFGQYSPPLLLGSPEEKQEAAKRMPYVPIKVIARVGLTPERMEELIEVLQTNLRKYQAKQAR